MANPFGAPYQVTQPFGCTGYPAEPAYGDCPHFHRGVDLVGPSANCPIYAVGDGAIYAAGQDADGAIYVIQHLDEGHWVCYWHLLALSVRNGQRVSAGQQVGNQGSTGNSDAPHLHLEIEAPGPWSHVLAMTPVDPTPFIQDQGGTNDVTPEQAFAEAFIAVAQRWPSPVETNNWKQSGMPSYAWIQKNAPNPAVDNERVQGFKNMWLCVTTGWPSDDVVNDWLASGSYAYEYVQKKALQPMLADKDRQLAELQDHPVTDDIINKARNWDAYATVAKEAIK